MKKEIFIDKDDLCKLISDASKILIQAADQKDFYIIKSYVDYINNFYEDIKEYESE